jgi:acyl-CoA thioesterase I
MAGVSCVTTAGKAAPGWIRGTRRIGRTILYTGIVAASLLVFPSAIPWMAAFWLVWHSALALRARPAWLPLATCAAAVVVKRPDWPHGLLVLVALMLIVCVSRAAGAQSLRTPWGWRLAWIDVIVLWIAWTAMAFQWHHAAHIDRHPALRPARPVVCIGDSLTAFGYPRCLERMLSIPVVDLSRDGMSAKEALVRLPSLIAANPQAVVIELGGHDFMRGYGRAATKANLEKIVDASRSVGAEVILMEIPRGFVTDPFDGLEREMARKRDLEIIPDTAIRRLVLWSPASPPGMWLPRDSRLSDDGLHPNSRGNTMLAECVAAALKGIYGSAAMAPKNPRLQ